MPGGRLGAVGRGVFLLDGDAVIILVMRAVGKRVAADQGLVAAGDIELEGEILARLEGGQRLAVVRLQIERTDVVAFVDFFGDGKFAVAVPEEAGLFDLAALEGGGLDEQLEALPGKGLMFASEIKAAQGEIEGQEALKQEHPEEDVTDDQY